MVQFDPATWIIEFCEHSVAEIESDPVVQARFVHEYVHYLQTLTGTLGRQILVELIRISIWAGLWKHYGGEPKPPLTEQIDLLATLTDARKSELEKTQPAEQFAELARQLTFTFARKLLTLTAPPPNDIVRRRFECGGNAVDDFPHIIARHPRNGVLFLVPITDGVVLENMARQVQRNYLIRNNVKGMAGDPSPVDSLQQRDDADLAYLCIHDAVCSRVPDTEPRASWTIAICQIALCCRSPGDAIERLLALIRRNEDRAAFVKRSAADPEIRDNYDDPPIQGVLDALCQKWGTVMKMSENWELRELSKLIAKATNTVRDNPEAFGDPLITWTDVLGWMRTYGCPRVLTADGWTGVLGGVSLVHPWQKYIALAEDRLAP